MSSTSQSFLSDQPSRYCCRRMLLQMMTAIEVDRFIVSASVMFLPPVFLRFFVTIWEWTIVIGYFAFSIYAGSAFRRKILKPLRYVFRNADIYPMSAYCSHILLYTDASIIKAPADTPQVDTRYGVC